MSNIIQSNLTYELGHNFINYAAAVNGDRATPDSLTGLKPVARRIMFVMEDEGYSSSKAHKKCAKIVGSVMGRVHPHGDSSIYEAMVRLSQPWVMRYPLLDWHGNNGNIAGDGAAAHRYTETRLAKISEEGLLQNLKKRVVDFQPNFSEDEEEPVTLPALFPNLLCNPNQGIGVAMACNWLPHNLTEVGNLILNYIDTNELDFTSMAPDFPTGGVIINGKDLKQIYTTGKGKVTLRGKYEVGNKRGNKTLLIFTEIPYGVRTEDLLDQIKEVSDKGDLTGVDEVRDESNKKGLRIVFELSKDANEGQVLKQLFKETDLQKSLSANQVALVEKTPVLLNWKQSIDIYIKHNIDIIRREAEFDLAKAKARFEIVEGLLRALEDIDNIIALIKGSASSAAAKTNLMEKYKFTENQAKAIVDMKLGKLAGLEKMELNEERFALDSKISYLTTLVVDEVEQRKVLRARLKDFVAKFGDKRRTEVTHIEIKPEEKEIAEVIPEDCVVILTQAGSIKRVPSNTFKIQKRNGKGVKNEDDTLLETISTNTIDTLMFFTNFGKMYRLVVDNVPVGTNASKGVPVSTLVNLENGEKVVAMTSLYRKTNAEYVVFITKQGMIKKSSIEEYTKLKKNMGLAAIKIKEGDAIANVTFLKDEELVLLTKKGMSIRFTTKDINPIGRVAMGVKSIKLGEDDEVLVGLPIHKDTDMVALISSNGFGKKVPLDEFPSQGRSGKGIIAYKEDNTIGNLVGAAMVSDEDNLLLIGRPNSICISSNDIPKLSRISVGNIMIKGSKLTKVVKL